MNGDQARNVAPVQKTGPVANLQPPAPPPPSINKPNESKPPVKKENRKPSRKKASKNQGAELAIDTMARYRTRIIKGTFLPILYVFISFLMMRNYVSEYAGFYDYEFTLITIGFILGLVTMSGITAFNLYRAGRTKKKMVMINNIVTIVAFTPVILIVIIIALISGISSSWQFSIGYFASAILPPFIVGFTELASKTKYYVDDIRTPKKAIKIVSVPNV